MIEKTQELLTELTDDTLQRARAASDVEERARLTTSGIEGYKTLVSMQEKEEEKPKTFWQKLRPWIAKGAEILIVPLTIEVLRERHENRQLEKAIRFEQTGTWSTTQTRNVAGRVCKK